MNSSFQVTDWFKKIGLPVRQISDSHWVLDLEHDRAIYSLSIKNHGHWFSYGAELMPEVEGTNKSNFLEMILYTNYTLNAAYIAKEGDRLVLIRNDFTEDINEETLLRSVSVFHKTHEYIYSTLLNEAKAFGLKFAH
jgi:hypothetical protein